MAYSESKVREALNNLSNLNQDEVVYLPHETTIGEEIINLNRFWGFYQSGDSSFKYYLNVVGSQIKNISEQLKLDPDDREPLDYWAQKKKDEMRALKKIKPIVYTPRPYQQRVIDSVLNYIKTKPNRNGYFIAPTGAGKSIIIANIAKQLDSPVMVLQPSGSLVRQNVEKFRSYGEKCSVFSASVGLKQTGGSVIFATPKSVRNAMREPILANQFSKIKYIIIDECDTVKPNQSRASAKKKAKTGEKFVDGDYLELLSHFPDAQIIGCTATPWRAKTEAISRGSWDKVTRYIMLHRSRPRIFEDVIDIIQISELYNENFLSKIKIGGQNFNPRQLVLNSTKSDYTAESIKRAMDENDTLGRIEWAVNAYIESGKKGILAFVPTIDDAKIMASRTGGAYVYGGQPQRERQETEQKFKDGEINHLYNVRALGVGFDAPHIDALVLGYPIKSPRDLYQFLGRAARICEGKEYAVCADLCNSVGENFGPLEDFVVKKNGRYYDCFIGKKKITGR